MSILAITIDSIWNLSFWEPDNIWEIERDQTLITGDLTITFFQELLAILYHKEIWAVTQISIQPMETT